MSGSRTPNNMTFTERVKLLIKAIPRGKVSTYGQIAAFAGDPRGARQVARILHSCSEKDNLPWYRMINRMGRISLSPGNGYELQYSLLHKEGICFKLDGSIDLRIFLWQPKNIDRIIKKHSKANSR